jgi:tetratricopeptide (TPR) repeat protein
MSTDPLCDIIALMDSTETSNVRGDCQFWNVVMPDQGDGRPEAMERTGAALRAKFERGLASHRNGNLADAERIYQEVLQRQPGHAGALQMLGVVAIETGRPEQGADLIRKAISVNANLHGARSNLAKALLDLNRPHEALANLDEAIMQEPDSAVVHNNRGYALLELKRPEEALASFDKAVSLQRDFPRAWNNRASALIQLCRWNEVEEACRKAIALRPDLADAWTNLGLALNELNRWEEAAAVSRKAVEFMPNESMAWNGLAYALAALGRWTEAEAASRKAVALKSDYREAWVNLSRALAAQNRRDEASEASRRALALTPKITGQGDFLQANARELREATNRLVAEARNKGTAFALEAEQIRALHRIAMKNLRPNPGEYRRKTVAIIKRPDLPPSWRDIPSLMDDMCRYVNTNWSSRDAIHLAAFVLWRLPWIHPFGDGNGKIARTVCNAILCIKAASSLRAKEFFIEAFVEKGTASYVAYITSLVRADEVYSQTQNIDQAVRHVEQWLDPLAREHLKA